MVNQSKSLSIVIPAYNEEKRIEGTLEKLFAYLAEEKIAAEIIVVNDGSNDGTYHILRRLEKKIKMINVYPNRGKGHAIKRGVLAAEGDLVLFMDADLATPLNEIGEFLNFSLLTDFDYDLLIGSRDMTSKKVKRHWLRSMIGSAFRLLAHLIVPLDIQDSQCGFKMFKKEAAVQIFKRQKIERWTFDIEALYRAKKLGYKIIEIPVAWSEMSGSRLQLLRDSFRMLRDLVKIRLDTTLYSRIRAKEALSEQLPNTDTDASYDLYQPFSVTLSSGELPVYHKAIYETIDQKRIK